VNERAYDGLVVCVQECFRERKKGPERLLWRVPGVGRGHLNMLWVSGRGIPLSQIEGQHMVVSDAIVSVVPVLVQQHELAVRLSTFFFW